MKRILPVFFLALLAVLPACKDSTGPSGPALSSLSVTPTPVYLGVNDTITLTANGTLATGGGAASDVTPKYKSANTSIATVTSAGVVRGVSAGTTTITATAGGQTATVTVNVLASGSIRTFNVNANDLCASPDYRGARIAATSAHAIVYADLNNPANGFTDTEYQAIANEFEQVVWPTDTQNFGTPTDIDGNGKVMILYTRAVNELSPANSNVVIGGFFYGRDLFPRTPTQGFEACGGSNYGEMFYMLVPDPSGTVNSNVRTKSYVRSFTVGTIAHEFQHLINASRRIYVNNANDYEDVWLDEGLAHVAEELNFYTATAQAPRQNLNEQQLVGTTQAAFNAFAAYQFQNFARLGEYLASPPNHSPWDSDDDLEQRGAAWSLLRYMADRRNGNDQQLWFNLVNSQTKGLANLQAVLGTDPVLLARDWSVMLYTDDAVPTPSTFQLLSWNLRSVYHNQNFGGSYPLQVTALTAGTSSVQIQSGSAAYRKFAVAPATTADVRVIQNSGAVAGACTPVNLAVGGVQQLALGAGLALCFPGGATGAEYVMVPFHAQPQQDTTVTVSMTATGVLPPVGPPTPDAITPRAPLFQLDGTSISHPYDGGFELRLRERERRLGKALVPRFNRADLVSAVASVIYVNVVRTK